MAIDAPVPAPDTDTRGTDGDQDTYMGVGDDDEGKGKRRKRGSNKKGGWMNEDGENLKEEGGEEEVLAGRKRGGNQRPRPQADEDGSSTIANESVATQSQVGKGGCIRNHAKEVGCKA